VQQHEEKPVQLHEVGEVLGEVNSGEPGDIEGLMDWLLEVVAAVLGDE